MISSSLPVEKRNHNSRTHKFSLNVCNGSYSHSFSPSPLLLSLLLHSYCSILHSCCKCKRAYLIVSAKTCLAWSKQFVPIELESLTEKYFIHDQHFCSRKKRRRLSIFPAIFHFLPAIRAPEAVLNDAQHGNDRS